MDKRGGATQASSGRDTSLAHRMSNHVAYGLLIYTLLMIFVVSPRLKSEGMSLWPYVLLVILVALFIPVLRIFEKRWARYDGDRVGEGPAPDPGTYRGQVILLWALSFVVPFIWLALFAVT